jgi:hypothetical protein
MLDLTGRMFIWGGIFAHGDGSTGLMKIVFATPYRRSFNGLGQAKHFSSGQPHVGHISFWRWGVTVWDCFSFECKMDLFVLDSNLTGQKYRDNVLATRVVLHFDNHALADRPIFMDDSARPHISLSVQHFYSKRLFRQFHGLRCLQI